MMNLSWYLSYFQQVICLLGGSTLGKGTPALAHVLSEAFRGQKLCGQCFPPEEDSSGSSLTL